MNPFELNGSSDQESEVQKRYNKILAGLHEVADVKGEGIDESIRESVASLNLGGFTTTASCGGHFEGNHGLCVPWVDISAPNEPKEQFRNQDEITYRVAKKYGFPMEYVKKDIVHEAYLEAEKDIAREELTPEFVAWAAENERLEKKMQGLLEEFYDSREVSDNVQIKIRGIAYTFRIYSGGEDYDTNIEELTDEERTVLRKKLEIYRKEMDDFGEFLRKKAEGGESIVL